VKTRAVLVRLEESLEAALREHAAHRGLSAAALTRHLIVAELAGSPAAKARTWKPHPKRLQPDDAAAVRALAVAVAQATGAMIMTARELRTRHAAPALYRETEDLLAKYEALLGSAQSTLERLDS
jgi:hypothetical protein